MALPTIKEIHNAKAGPFWNLLCCPLVMTIGMIYRSFAIFCLPCINVLSFRCVHSVWKYCCCCLSWPYEDDTFIGASALGDFTVEGKGTAAQMEAETDWVRAQDLKSFKGKRPQLFEGEIEPSDLAQGAVGDCWLVAAFACASEFPDCIRQMFGKCQCQGYNACILCVPQTFLFYNTVTKEYNPRGLYKVRIFDPCKKKFEIVTVDDRIPCKKGTKKPRFMSPNGNELWAIILEKAYAKWCGSYAKLSGGMVLWGWLSMTGDNVFQLSVDPSTHKWTREDMVAIKDKNDKRACGFRVTKEKYSNDNLWTLLKKYDKQKALISASIGKMDYRFVGCGYRLFFYLE